MKRYVATVVLLGMLLLTACTSSLVPSNSDSAKPSSSDSVSKPRKDVSTPDVTPTPTPTPIVTVAQPWSVGEFQEGVQIYWHSTGDDDYIKDQAEKTLDYVVSLGANSVSLTFPIYTDGPTPNSVYPGAETPSVHQLALVTEAAKLRKLRVMLRPVIDEANIMTYQDQWRGSIRPQSIEGWFAQYTNCLMPFFALADEQGVDEFVVATELLSLERYTDQWSLVAQSAQTVYGGMLSYGVNWNGFDPSRTPFSSLGLDFYIGTDFGDSATSDELAGVMSGWLLMQPEDVRARLTLQEVGIASETGAFQHSWYWGKKVVDPAYFDMQARWFTAAYRAARATGTQGIYYWMIDSNQQFDQAGIDSQPAGGFVGRPGAQAIQQSFSSP